MHAAGRHAVWPTLRDAGCGLPAGLACGGRHRFNDLDQATAMSNKPAVKPACPNFSSGPCAKRPGFDINQLDLSVLGRSHRSALGKKVLGLCCSETARILGLPEGYRVGVVPASDTGAMEMAMWSLLGPRGVDVFAWENFGSSWVTDAEEQLKLDEVNSYVADYGELPDLSKANFANDVIFTWNGTASGVKVPHGDWIPDDRQGLTLCDATSAIFAMDMPWHKLDVITYSWQKVLGGEAGHGMLILSPRAVERLESHEPSWPMPKIFRMTKKDKAGKPKLNEAIFEGSTINTPSMLCAVDYLGALAWAESEGGVPGLIKRSMANYQVIEDFVAKHDWVDFLAKDPATRSNTGVCLTLDLPADRVKKLVALLGDEGVAYDFGAYRAAPAGLRIWCGSTVETSDVEALMPWIEWGYEQVKA